MRVSTHTSSTPTELDGSPLSTSAPAASCPAIRRGGSARTRSAVDTQASSARAAAGGIRSAVRGTGRPGSVARTRTAARSCSQAWVAAALSRAGTSPGHGPVGASTSVRQTVGEIHHVRTRMIRSS